MRLRAVLWAEAEHDNFAFSIVNLYKSGFIMEDMISDKTTTHEWIAVGITGYNF